MVEAEMDYSRYLNKEARRRKSMTPLGDGHSFKNPSTVDLGLGFPSPDTFPVKSITFELSDGDKITLDPTTTSACLQYGPMTGIVDVMSWVAEFLGEFHSPPGISNSSRPSGDDEGQRISIAANGSQDAMFMMFAALVTKGDNVLIEETGYMGAIALFRSLGANIIPVKTGAGGIDADHLERILQEWPSDDVTAPTRRAPKLLYLVPTAGNPTGQTLPRDRRKKIYELAKRFDLLILEDDPYYFLSFESSLVPSFLSMDTDGRVIRFDSFSKIISPGMRFGIVTGPKAIMQSVVNHIEMSSLHSNNLAQMLTFRLLQHWGSEGFKRHVDKLVAFYKSRCETCLQAVEKHLTGLAEWNRPMGGFFLWLKLNGVDDTLSLLLQKAFKAGVVYVPGRAFDATGGESSSYVRLSYASASPDDISLGIKRMAEILKDKTSASEG